ncbi:Archaeophage PsiM2, terminase large subunit [uncultured Caudovirales phage]|uniref:Archaeophage PsiM2, terminase large subunit n=1 Tax=uncultured Caudovirales phage TaxID=2100421 RepID=A0A6J5S9W9_9CAUD|nr:Archaeophage PsiM2, terminase large subunit [uncultured Caudovirales phage]CAB4210524.1 Archaeophage PsiM2, terminase large subunit [uncultured Caudovirales phage]CAB4223492.1 Archaeophage PsiM2, terminase large subunit [uncultured Caudovirales phage]
MGSHYRARSSTCMSQTTIEVRPQPGPQEAFLSTSADIAIFGGAAGGGKSWGLLLEPLRHIHNPGFGAVIFRRTSNQVRNEGGLWDESLKLYPLAGGEPKESILQWNFPEGPSITFAHIEHEKTKLNWQGSQIPLIAFDELTHFTKGQFFYLLSRNRSTCGVKPYIRATCNPDPDSFVAELIRWWIDQDTGYAIPERSGVIRWFVMLNDEIFWGDTPDELKEKYGADVLPKSLTFIAARLEDNQILMKADPGYLANLKALPLVERERLLGGNWKIRPSAGLYFRRDMFEIVEAVPISARRVRGWDFAATDPKDVAEGVDPDWTAGVKMSRDGGTYYIEHVERLRGSPQSVERSLLNTTRSDGVECEQSIPQDPGQAGKYQVKMMVKLLAGFTVRYSPETGDKIVRASPLSAQAEAGNVKLLRGSWNEALLSELENFPSLGAHDDQVDAASRAFHMLARPGEPRIRSL